MTKATRQWMVGALMVTGLAGAAGRAEAAGQTSSTGTHVRSSHPSIEALIVQATEQSTTFRDMVETINASDGIVYVEPGGCRHGVRACLVKVTSAGRHRSLFVKVYLGRNDRELIAAIGHELRHAIEVLSASDRVDTPPPAFETKAAIKAGEAVADEIRQFQGSAHDEPIAATDQPELTIVLHESPFPPGHHARERRPARH